MKAIARLARGYNWRTLVISLALSVLVCFTLLKIAIFKTVLFSALFSLLWLSFRNRLKWVFRTLLAAIGALWLFWAPSFVFHPNPHLGVNQSAISPLAATAKAVFLTSSDMRQNYFLAHGQEALRRLIPTRSDAICIVLFVTIALFLLTRYRRKIFEKLPNRYFETVSAWLLVFSTAFSTSVRNQVLISVSLTSLWTMALWSLGLPVLPESLIMICLLALTPRWGFWLAGIFPWAILDYSQVYSFQLIGLVVALAAIWLVHFLLLHRIPVEIERECHFCVLLGFCIGFFLINVLWLAIGLACFSFFYSGMKFFRQEPALHLL